MKVTLARRAARLPFAPIAATMFGVAGATLMAIMPRDLLEQVVNASHLPSIIAATKPALGMKARLLLDIAGFVGLGGLSYMIFRPIGARLGGSKPAKRWADHGYRDQATVVTPPAPAAADDVPVESRRRPIFAPDELGAPLMSDEAIAAAPPVMPADPALEAPLELEEFAIFDESTAEPEAPNPVEQAVAEYHDETPVAPEGVEPIDAPADMPESAKVTAAAEAPVHTDAQPEKASINALIERLEAGLARHNGGDGPDGSAAGKPQTPRWLEAARNEMRENEADNGLSGDVSKDLREALGAIRSLGSGR